MAGSACSKTYEHVEPPKSICIVTDGHEGLLAAVKALFSATPRQRCLLHKQRNVLNAVSRRVRHDVETELLGIWTQPTKEGP